MNGREKNKHVMPAAKCACAVLLGFLGPTICHNLIGVVYYVVVALVCLGVVAFGLVGCVGSLRKNKSWRPLLPGWNRTALLVGFLCGSTLVHVQENIATQRGNQIVSDLLAYKSDIGDFPETLSGMYGDDVPTARIGLMGGGEYGYFKGKVHKMVWFKTTKLQAITRTLTSSWVKSD